MEFITVATDSHVSRVNNAIGFVKERLSAIQSETPFQKYLKKVHD